MRLSTGEKVLYRAKPDKKIMFVWFFLKIVPIAILIAAFAYVYIYLLFSVRITRLTFALATIVAFLYYLRLSKTYKYCITNERIVFEGGLLMKRSKNIPFPKVTDVSISQNILERIVDIASLNVQTAGKGIGDPEIQFVGLQDAEKPEALILNQLESVRKTKRSKRESEND